MSPQDEQELAYARSYEEAVHRNRALAGAMHSEGRKRLVWFVAIAGYVLVNAQPLWELSLGRSLEQADFFWLAAPWVLAASIAIVTHILADKLSTEDAGYYVAKVAALQVFCLNRSTGQEPPCSFADIINNKGKLTEHFDSVERWRRRLTVLERLTQALVALGFLSTIFAAWILAGSPRQMASSAEHRYSWAFAQNLDNSLHTAEVCRESLAQSLYYAANVDRLIRQGESNVFLFTGAVESFRIHGFYSQTECETALTGIAARLRGGVQ